MSRSLRFVHAADLHLDTPFEGIAKPAPAVAKALQDASLQAWDNVVSLTIQAGAALLLIAGDIYDGADRGMRAQLRFVDGLKRLSSAGTLTFIVHGNHDPLDGWSAVRQWPEGVTVFGSDAVESVTTKADGQTVHVHGISYRTRELRDNLARQFTRSKGRALNIGLLHTNACGDAEHAAYCPCSLGDLDAAGMDYWALGHIHRQQFLRSDGPWAAYSGNTQGRSPKPSETGPKGVLLADTAGSSITSVRFEPVDVVRFVTCSLDVAAASDVPALQIQVNDLVEGLRRANDGRALLIRVVLEGRGPTSRDLRREGALAELTDELRSAWYGRDPFVWIEAIRDRSRMALELESIRRRNDFSAELLELAESLGTDSESVERFVEDAAGMLRDPGQVERALRDLGSDAPGELLAEALELALGELEIEVEP